MTTNCRFRGGQRLQAGRDNAARRWCLFWLVVLLSWTLPHVAQAQFTWTTNLDDTITITSYTGSGGEVDIPDAITDRPVTSIGASTFYYFTDLTSVTMGTNLVSIGQRAFVFCTNLTSVVIPDSVTNIGDYAFQGCWGLTNVSLPKSLTSMGKYLFLECYSLTRVTIPNGVTNIGNYAFQSCTNLSSVTIPDSVVAIGAWAFNACLSLTNVTFGSNVTSIGQSAFEACYGLTTITLPESVISIGGGVFRSCTGLTNMTIPDGMTSIPNTAFWGCTSLTSITLPNGVTNIDDLAFYNCQKLSSLTIPASVGKIGNNVFQNCTMSSMFFEGDAPAVGTSVFLGDSSTIIYYFAGTTGWGATFAGRPAFLWDAEIPYRYTTTNGTITLTGYIAGYTNSEPPVMVTIPSTINGQPVTSIGSRAFYNLKTLQSVTIPNGVTSVGVDAFTACTGLTGAYFEGNAPSVDFTAFRNANAATVYYLPGTTGWGSTFASRPTWLWQPRVVTSDATFGVRNSQFGFTIDWASGMTFVVECSTSLVDTVWSPLQTNTPTGSSVYFSDPDWTNHPVRFYRVRWP